MSLRIGSRVKFNLKVYSPPYSPYYDAYFDQIFQVLLFHVLDGTIDNLIECGTYAPGCHVELMCITNPAITVAGLVHDDEIYEV